MWVMGGLLLLLLGEGWDQVTPVYKLKRKTPSRREAVRVKGAVQRGILIAGKLKAEDPKETRKAKSDKEGGERWDLRQPEAAGRAKAEASRGGASLSSGVTT